VFPEQRRFAAQLRPVASQLPGLIAVRRNPGHTGAGVGERLVTTAEAARLLGVSRSTVQRYVKAGLLRPAHVLPCGHLRWDLDDLRRQLREVQQGGDE
jgi:excisionase family DNA binding protein